MCTNEPKCLEDNYMLIKEKRKCIDNCEKDNTYKYQYNGECFIQCPNGTINDNNQFLCKNIAFGKCTLRQKKYESLNADLNEEEVESLAKGFAKEFNYTSNHVSIFNNSLYSITLYKNNECISELKIKIPELNFGECYEKVKSTFHIDDNLVIAVITKKADGEFSPKMIYYSMHDPKDGKELDYYDICKDEPLEVKEDLLSKIDSQKNDLNSIKFLTEQKINIFNLSGEFYSDICYHFKSLIDKDIPLKDRFLLFYPNITLCENGCQIKGVNLSSFKAICECKFTNLMNDINSNINSLENNALYQNYFGQIKEMKLLNAINIFLILNMFLQT